MIVLFAFNIKGPLADIDDIGGGDLINPAKILLIEWDDDIIRQVVVPLDIFEPYKDALHFT